MEEKQIKKINNYKINRIKAKAERNGLGLLKTLSIIVLVAFQLSLFIVSYLYIATYVEYYLLFSLVATFAACLHVICSKRNSLSKPVWILFLLITFAFGYIFYFLSDERIFWHKSKKRYDKILAKVKNYKTNTTDNIILENLEETASYLKKSGFPAYSSTESTYFSDGAPFMNALTEKLKSAKKFIFIEFFIISDGKVFSRIFDILKEKVKSGVEVRIIYDDLGSHRTLPRKTKKKIKKAGIKLSAFNKLLPYFSIFINYRDHRKIVVIDGKFAFTGGINLADEYTNEKQVHGIWKDSGLMLSGPAVDELTLAFLSAWEFLNKSDEDFGKFLSHAEKTENTSIVIPYLDGLEFERNIGKDVYTSLISSAKEKIYIMSPYLVLDDTIKNLLILKAESGVDVRIIIPEIADKKLVYIQTRNIAEKLMLNGVKLYTLKNSFVHSKILLTESSAVVGSINFDLRSFYQQFENAVLINDTETLNDINFDFLSSFSSSTEITQMNMNRRYLTFRMLAGLTSIISPFM